MLIQQPQAEPSTTSSLVRLVGVPWYWVDHFWGQVSPLIEKAIPYSETEYTLDDIHSGLMSRNFQLWVIFEGDELLAAGVTQITQTECWIFALGGKGMNKWLHTLDQIKEWSGKPIRYAGRRGWKRVLGG